MLKTHNRIDGTTYKETGTMLMETAVLIKR
jgi:hypothetical protein